MAAAFRRFVLDGSERLASEEVADVIASAARVIGASPGLRAREREVVDETTRSLALLIAEETGAADGDVVPWAVANALLGAQRGLVEHTRASVLAGRRGRELAGDVRAQGKRAFARLERGLGGFAVRPPARRPGRRKGGAEAPPLEAP